MVIVEKQAGRRRVKRTWGKKPAATPPPPVTAPIMMSAEYVAGQSVTLTFDQAIDIAAIAVRQMYVADASDQHKYVGGGAELVSPTVVRITLQRGGVVTAVQTTFNASASNGIAASAGGMAWSGVSGWVVN